MHASSVFAFNTRFTKMTIFCHCLSKRLIFSVLLISHFSLFAIVFLVILLIVIESFVLIRKRIQTGGGDESDLIFFQQ